MVACFSPSSSEHRAGWPVSPPSSRLLFASGTQLPHLTFSIWPLPRGEIASRVSKRGCHTSWILLSFNLPGPFSPWPCTWIRDGDIAQLWEYLTRLPRYTAAYFGAVWRFWCIVDMDIGFITFVWCGDIRRVKERNAEYISTVYIYIYIYICICVWVALIPASHSIKIIFIIKLNKCFGE